MTDKISSFVNTLQKQPLETRKHILMFGSFGITALIVVIWLASFAFSHSTHYVAQNAIGDSAQPSESPFAIIKGSVVQLYANAKTGYDAASQK